MLSRLDPIFQTILRRTEETDTRLHIRRDESQGWKKGKKGPETGEYAPLAWEDSTSVSVAALKSFLQILRQGSVLDSSPASSELEISEESVKENDHSPGHANYLAARAYQTTARVVHDPNIEMPSPAPPSGGAAAEAVSLGSDFSESDLANVDAFIADLMELERRGVTELTIQRSQTFLEGVRQAIAEAFTAIL